MMSQASWILLLSLTAHQLITTEAQESFPSDSLSKRLAGGAMSPDTSNWVDDEESPGLLMNNYLAFLSRLAKKDLQDDLRSHADVRSPKRDNRKFQTQGWR